MKGCRMSRGIDVVILCGGKGMRLRSVIRNRPKSMAEFVGKPFLLILMEYLAGLGFRRFILCTGYMGYKIKEYFRKKSLPWEILYSQERKALGTGGAIKKTYSLVQSPHFLAMNGDSFCKLDMHKFIDFHLRKKALLSMALANNSCNPNCGKVVLDSAQRIVRFEEKASYGINQFESAGIYLMERKIFTFMDKKESFSLEYDLFPSIIDKKRCYGFKQGEDLIDFGTPAEYRKAKGLFSKVTILPKGS